MTVDAEEERRGPAGRGRRPRAILLIEPDATRRAVVHDRVAAAGFDVMSAYDAPDAEAALSWTKRGVDAAVVGLDVRDPRACEQAARLVEAHPDVRLVIATRNRSSRPGWAPPPGALLIDLPGATNLELACAVCDALVALPRGDETL